MEAPTLPRQIRDPTALPKKSAPKTGFAVVLQIADTDMINSTNGGNADGINETLE